MKSKLTRNQKIVTPWRLINDSERMKVAIRYDDECGNGHNSFAITAEIQEKRGGAWKDSAFGCLHDQIREHFPEYKDLIKWHLCSSDGPMHYISNTLYHASDRDCWGLKAGEVKTIARAIKFNGFPFTFRNFGKYFLDWLLALGTPERESLMIESVHHPREPLVYGANYTFCGFATKWHECPFNDVNEASEFLEAIQRIPFEVVETPTAWGEGKAPDYEAARSCGIWPDATDEDLQSPDLKQKLEQRLMPLIEQFKNDVTKLGFTY